MMGQKYSSGISVNLYKREDAHFFRYSVRRSSYGENGCFRIQVLAGVTYPLNSFLDVIINRMTKGIRIG
jgi:hypothetical protein